MGEGNRWLRGTSTTWMAAWQERFGIAEVKGRVYCLVHAVCGRGGLGWMGSAFHDA